MKKVLVLVGLLLALLKIDAQYHVTFIVNDKAVIHHDSIFVTGTFSKWDSTANKNYLLKPVGSEKKSITLTLKPGAILYKYHRGGWNKVEKQYNGDEVANREVMIRRDTTLVDSVLSWRDQEISDKWQQLYREKTDTGKLGILASLASNYAFWAYSFNLDSALYYSQQALLLMQKINHSGVYTNLTNPTQITQVINIQEITASLMHSLGNYTKALELRFENLKLAEKLKNGSSFFRATKNIASDYLSMKDYPNVLHRANLMDSMVSTLPKNDQELFNANWYAKNMKATAYYYLTQYDSALYYAKKMELAATTSGFVEYVYKAFGNMLLADIYAAKEKHTEALSYYRAAITAASVVSSSLAIAGCYGGIAKLYRKTGNIDSALYYARLAFSYYQNKTGNIQSWGENSAGYLADISPLVADLYKANHQMDSAYKYLHYSVVLKDSLYNSAKIRQFQTLTFNEAARRQQLEQQSKEAQQQYDTMIKMYVLIIGLLSVLVITFVLFRNNKQQQKANTLLFAQKQEIESTLDKLKITQKQLIQSEKMASLGELTAGIAHEIQNPLNFVNNFSEVNKELLEELKAERLKPNADRNEENENGLINDVISNEEKINHHGKRADAIVKGMLQHSRSSTGVKELTDINLLADEYLRLAYHGLRAKDKSFNATLITDFDDSIGMMNMIPQDMGRVILNLITNAFYTVEEKKKMDLVDYEPTISVTTKKTDGHVLISVTDNGNGIAKHILDKIFHPFFTTKPTGQGTGLGLSLSYDIIKAHGGELTVETKEGVYTRFVISLSLERHPS
jgi:signal transduction histidine kinase